MHTFDVDADGTVTVGRLERRRIGTHEVTDEFVSMRKFTDPCEAIAFVNLLNGGDASTNKHYIDSLLDNSTPCRN